VEEVKMKNGVFWSEFLKLNPLKEVKKGGGGKNENGFWSLSELGPGPGLGQGLGLGLIHGQSRVGTARLKVFSKYYSVYRFSNLD